MTARRTRHRRVAPIELADFPKGTRSDVVVDLFEDGLGTPVGVPIVVVRGKSPGPVVGLTAAVHGDELNGVRAIHELLASLDPATLVGAVVCCPIVNVPAYRNGERRFPDGTDLNHSFPGKRNGRTSEQYARRFAHTFLPPLDVLIDIHTASDGRINSFYARGDLQDAKVRQLAGWLQPELILHARGGDGTLRAAARRRGIVAVTAEVGDPRAIQASRVAPAVDGLRNILERQGMIPPRSEVTPPAPPIYCRSSEWLYTNIGGLLSLHFRLLDRIEKGQTLAVVRDAFGHAVAEFKAPRAGVVIGMARDPVAVPGTRYCHLGALGAPLTRGEGE